MGGGYVLYFKNIGVYIKDIYSFFFLDFIIEFMVCVENFNGIFILYFSLKMFVVILEIGKIKLRYEDIILDILVIIELKEWNYIVLVWLVFICIF